ncbi:hypothetical protein BX600DRAFT_471607 [Xylariales sp. PMI_506]|nr:hypothetical protein BX600DRAFT_471607 [Xylariales sp. PMI_506]
MSAVWKPFSKHCVGWTVVQNGEELFKTAQPLADRLKSDAEIEWLDRDHRVIAIEERVVRTELGTIITPPKLRLKVDDLSEKDLDFLVTIWLVRIWKESAKENEEREDPKNSFFKV